MVVRTYYWQQRVKRIQRRGVLGRTVSTSWNVGNAGDIYNADLIEHLYAQRPENLTDQGRRIFLVGSTLRQLRDADVVAGAGAKGPDVLPAVRPTGVQVIGVRGPKTEQVLRDAGYDLSRLEFYGDPGLLIGEVFPALRAIEPEVGRVGFVPHYRETAQYRSTKKYHVIDADANAYDFATQIARCEVVYSSSLHGTIFAHALGRPATLVSPRTKEPEFKYRDYYASVSLAWQAPTSISHALKHTTPQLPSTIDQMVRAFSFPTLTQLQSNGVAD